MSDEVELTQEEEQELMEALGNRYDMPKNPEKEGVFAFLNKVFKTKNTSKVSNLTEEELFAVRNLQKGGIYAREMGMDLVSDYLMKESEVLLSTANSRQGFLVQAAITSKRQLESQTKIAGGNKKGWLNQKKD